MSGRHTELSVRIILVVLLVLVLIHSRGDENEDGTINGGVAR
jgi:hypothetical protein